MGYKNIIYLFLLNQFVFVVAKSSLTFVIDDTGSMGDDIEQVKMGANLVFDTVLNTNSSQIENFILVTFNDPVPPILRAVTRDRDLFKDELESINVGGGGDCPELSMSGIELALKESLPSSYIYVFTDATAKDVRMLESVQNLAIKKSSQIVFLLTGQCIDDMNDPHFQSYYQLAKATSGQVFHIYKQDVKEILNYVADTVSHPKTVIGSREFPPGTHNFTVPVDAGMKSVVFSVTGKEPKLNITSPDGITADHEKLVHLPGALVVKVPHTDTDIHEYKVVESSKSAATVVTSAASTIQFKYSFSPVEPTSINDGASQPIEGTKAHIAIQLDTENNDAVLNTLEIVDIDGTLIKEVPLRLINQKQKLYVTEQLIPPNTLFKIAVKGVLERTKSNFKRISPTAIEPQKPSFVKPKDRAANVTIAEKVLHIEYGQPLKISCKVNGFPKPDTMWLDQYGKTLPSEEFVIESPYDYLIVLEVDKVTDNGAYKCKATNSLGDASEVVTVQVEKESPKINKTTKVINKKMGEDAEINCKVTSGMPSPKIFWYFESFKSQGYEKIDGSEVVNLNNIDISQGGIYRCVAINVFGYDDHNISLIVEYPPTIQNGPSFIKSREGKFTSLSCYVQGYPKPRVDWFLEGTRIISDRKHHIYRDNSLRFIGSKEDSGRFTCVASNPHGSANRTILVQYIGPVSIQTPEQSTFALKVGDDVTLPCRATGYPQPSIKWLFYSEDRSLAHKKLRSSDASGTLNLRRLQLDQSGYYVCVASNQETSANMTYQVKVFAPPEIEKTMDRSFTAVLGDTVLRLPCKATGNPKPALTWTKDGLNIASGTEWYEIKGDGSLFIKNVDEKSAGAYVCHAENPLGDDQELYSVTVKPYPDERLTSDVLTLEEGSTKNVECDIPHTRVDSLRWFKDRRLFLIGELTLRNVQLSDTGIYTCRVSTDSNAQSMSVKVLVGAKPTFVSEASSIINFEEDSPAFLDCTAFGEPVPEVTWYYEDKQTDFKDMVYDIVMTMGSRGKYRCIVSNSFGTISRDFEISSRDCVLDISKDFGNKQPLMLNTSREWPSYESIDGYLRIPFNNSVYLYCPSGFSTIPEINVLATCERDNTFRINRDSYKYSELACREEVDVVVRKTGRQCVNEYSEEVKVGYMASGRFLEAFEVCIDKEKNAPVYAKHRLRRSLADTEPKNMKWLSDDSIPLDVEEIYDCDIQINHISSLLQKWFHADDKCCFKKRQLINPRDLPAGLAQKAGFSYVNVVPQWSSCNSKNWDELERRVRDLAQSSYEDFDVWTGTAESLTMEDVSSALVDLKLEDNGYLQQAVPRYVWKVVQSPSSKSSLAIVQLNIPDLTPAEAYRHVICEDICRNVPWMKGHYWRNPTNGYTFCCSLDQFEEAFGYEGYFGYANRNILYNPDLSSSSLIL